MTSFEWFARVAREEGYVMCCLCFEAVSIDRLHVDANGQHWDVCLTCKALEEGLIRRAASKHEGPSDDTA